jgi:hypothetical protein
MYTKDENYEICLINQEITKSKLAIILSKPLWLCAEEPLLPFTKHSGVQ